MKNYQQKAVETNDKKSEFNPPSVTAYMTPASKLITFHPDTEITEVVERSCLRKLRVHR
jgi:hypothetical protein